MNRTYRGTTIDRVRGTGYYRAHVLVGSVRTGYYVALQADTLAGIKEAITETLARNGQTREAL